MRSGRAAVVTVVAVACALLLLAVWGSGSGDQVLSTPTDVWEPPDRPPLTLPTVDVPERTEAPVEGGPSEESSGMDWVVVLVVSLVALLLAALARWLRRQRWEPDPPPQAGPDELTALLEATDEEVRYRALSEGDPRNAVVACWVALEDAVARAGLERSPSETATELTSRVLGRWDVDPAAITDLSEAYREARFSRHPVTEDQRRAAVTALERINTDLRARAARDRDARDQQAHDREPATRTAPQESSPSTEGTGR